MRTALHASSAIAALGAGIVHLGAAVGAEPLALALLLALGLAELGWAIAALRLGRAPLPAIAIATAVAGLAALGAAVLLGAPLDYPALLGGAALQLLAVIGVLLTRRLGAGRARTGRYLLGLLAGALLVGAIVTPSLAATEAGGAAVPHGEHGLPDAPSGHGH